MSTVKVNAPIGVCGRFKIIKGTVDKYGKEVVTGEIPWFDNLITDWGMNFLGTDPNVDPAQSVQVGSGSATPNFSDTTLSNRLAGTNNTVSGGGSGMVVGPPRYSWKRIVWRFAQGQAAGNLTELGVSQQVSSPLFSRTLIKDSDGNPTSITVLPTEFLDIIWEYRLYIQETTYTDTVTIDGDSYAVRIRPASFSRQYSWWSQLPRMSNSGFGYDGRATVYPEGQAFPAIGADMSGGISSTSHTFDPYVQGSFRLSKTSVFSINQANWDITIIGQEWTVGHYIYEFTPPLSKDNTKQLHISLGIEWSRYTP